MASEAVASKDCQLVLWLPVASDASLSATGGEVALATRHGAIIADLERQPEAPQDIRWWRAAGPTLGPAVSRVAFSPHRQTRHQLAFASERSVFVVDANPDAASTMRAESSKSGPVCTIGVVKSSWSKHLRPVTALDWSPHNPELLATCGEDCRFFIWDVRHPQPAQSLLLPSAWTASVKWAALEEFTLATGHEDTLCIWDIRSSSQQMSVLAPGQSRVLGVDWSPHERGKLLSVSAQQGAHATASGFIKIWDTSSQARVHDSIDVENGLPGAARFLPFGPAVLAAIDSTVVVFSLHAGGGRKAKIVKQFAGHAGPVSGVDCAGCGGADGDWRLVSFSPAEKCLRSWRYTLPKEFQDTVVERARTMAAPPTATPTRSPLLLPHASPKLGRRMHWAPQEQWETQQADVPADEARYLGCLAQQAAQLRRLPGVDEVTSYKEGLGVEYQLMIEVATQNGIRLRITVGVDPAAPATRRAASATKTAAAKASSQAADAEEPAQGQGLRRVVEWADEWAGTFDGPLAPGVIEETFGTLSLVDLLNGGGDLCRRVQALVRMLQRRDGPPRLVGVNEAEEVPPSARQDAKQRRPGAKDDLPYPRTCGVCWSPHGDLLCFRSVKHVALPFPRRWSSTDFRRVLKIHHQKQLRTLLTDDDDEHTAAAARMHVDTTVHIIPTAVLCNLVADHWWAAAAPHFIFETSLARPHVADVCRSNGKIAGAIGRADLAEVWRLAAVLAEAAGGEPEWLRTRPFALQLVRQMLHQLFENQETLTLAMLGSVLLCVSLPSEQAARGARGGGGAGEPEDSPGAAASEAGPWPPPGRRRRPWRPQSLTGAARWGQGPEAGADWNSQTWSHNTPEVSDFVGAVRSWRGPMGFRGRQAAWPPLTPGSEEAMSPSTLPGTPLRSPLDAKSMASAPEAPLPPAASATRPRVSRVLHAEGPQDLLPRDEQTLGRLLHSAHAHCSFMHSLGEFAASRALAKLLHKLGPYHNLPLLNAGGSRFAVPEAQLEAAGVVAALGQQLQQPSLLKSPTFGVREAVREVQHQGTAAAESRRPNILGGRTPFMVCGVCCLRVQTLCTPCWHCNHGFHLKCYRAWFSSLERKCPTIGCECRCLQHRSTN